MSPVVNNSIVPAGATLIPAMDAFRSIGVGRTRAYEYLNAGRVPAVKLGKRTMVRAADFSAFIADLPAYSPRTAA